MRYSPLKPGNRVILISGANRGIGRAIAERLYEEGYLLSLGARRVETLSLVAAKMKRTRVFTHAYDACKPDSAKDWVAATVRRFKHIDGVVNSAGISPYFGVEDVNEELLDEMWTVNAKGSVAGDKSCLSPPKKISCRTGG
jgi:NADP-dependent 3-hydroxy acid dehydrogenase YdfG